MISVYYFCKTINSDKQTTRRRRAINMIKNSKFVIVVYLADNDHLRQRNVYRSRPMT